MKRFLLLIPSVLIILGVNLVGSTRAEDKTLYPILELGGCSSRQDCFDYCEIPENTPACWSYNKYVLRQNVLGVTTQTPEEKAQALGVTFPVTELGNCSSVSECSKYCTLLINQKSCLEFAKKSNLNSQKKILESVKKKKLLDNAQGVLGCSDLETCRLYCNVSINRSKCLEFARNMGAQKLVPSTAPQPTLPPGVFEVAQNELGCDSVLSCKEMCNIAENFKKCEKFAKEHNLLGDREQIKEQLKDELQEKQEDNQNTYVPDSISLTPTTTATESGFKAKRGCRTEKECRELCKKNPSSCPGFKPTDTAAQP